MDYYHLAEFMYFNFYGVHKLYEADLLPMVSCCCFFTYCKLYMAICILCDVSIRSVCLLEFAIKVDYYGVYNI